MYPKRSSQGDGSVARPVRTSDRIRRRPKNYGRSYFYSYPIVHAKKRKTKTRTAAAHIAKMLLPASHAQRTPNPSRKIKTRTAAAHIAKMLLPASHAQRTPNTSSTATNLRRSSRKRVSVHFEDYTDSSGMEDEDLMVTNYRSSRNRGLDNTSQDELSNPKRRKLRGSRSVPRREGLRPRRSNTMTRSQSNLHLNDDVDEPATSDEKVGPDETENGNDGDDTQNGVAGEDDADAEGEDDGEEDGDDDDEDDGEDEQEGRRRYHLRNRADVQRHSMDSSKQITRSPRRALHRGMGNKVGRDVRKGGSRVHKRHRMPRAEDSDDSLLVDELNQGPQIPWARGGNRTGSSWVLGGGLDMPGSSSWGLNVAASGWGQQADAFAALSSGVQTAGPSSKGGADIQPLQVDENVSFDDIGGLSEYIDSLKEMVFFPLLYPDFFASYHITPPRGVLLCGPPGTGKTLIARALASAASKAGQKVSFYMRKGADVLSKWVGEAERQLKLLFEEAQRNQPSIIFFDEIDGLAPVRSSKQEQIHNSIVSTLLALMDGLDSRGQVVLIGATNRIDAIDGALRRPGRFDREFNFPLPGSEARAEILDIHTRKWKMPPSEELRLELAASCVGYCGADLKALCTEAAIRAFRERYPQVYTSDDKFLIDVDSVKVQKYHFLESMSAITPAAHRGSVVHSRPLSSVVAPCLKGHLEKAMAHLSDIFPPISVSSEFSQLSVLSYGSAFPLVYKPRLLLCGSEGVGLDHLGPAILHEMEKFPVHSLGLPSLLSDPSAKTPEEALVHIFGEARRTTPSILYLPQFHLWWETAHEQLRAVLLTLLEELPPDLPILLLGISQVAPNELGPDDNLIFPQRSVYRVGNASAGDREFFFHHLIEAALSVATSNVKTKDSSESVTVPELPKAPQVPAGPKPSELKAKFESEQHALRRFRMCLRDICNRVLYDKRFRDFHFPVTEEDAPNYRNVIQNPLDMSSLLQRVDSGQYITCSTFLQDVDLIVANAKVYNGDDYNGARIVSRAHELRDSVQGMVSQMDPALVNYCDKIASQGGPMALPDDIGVSTFPSIPVVQLGTVTRASARLRNSQPEMDVDQRYEALKRPKKNLDSGQEGGEEKSKASSSSSHEEEVKTGECPTTTTTTRMDVDIPTETTAGAEEEKNTTTSSSSEEEDGSKSKSKEEAAAGGGCSVDADEWRSEVESIQQCFVKHTENYDIPQLEMLYNRVLKGVFATTRIIRDDNPHLLTKSILSFLFQFSQDKANF